MQPFVAPVLFAPAATPFSAPMLATAPQTMTARARSLVILEQPDALFERDRRRSNTMTVVVALPTGFKMSGVRESGWHHVGIMAGSIVFGSFPRTICAQSVAIKLHLVYETEAPVLIDGFMGTLIQVEEGSALHLTSASPTCRIPFRVNALSGKHMFRLVVAPATKVTADGEWLEPACTLPFRVVSKIARPRDANVGAIESEGTMGDAVLSGRKRARFDPSDSEAANKRMRFDADALHGAQIVERLVAHVIGLTNHIDVMHAALYVVSQQQAALARVVLEQSSAPTPSPSPSPSLSPSPSPLVLLAASQ